MSWLPKTLTATLVCVVVLIGVASVAKADPLILTLTNPNQTGLPSTTLTFSGSILNSGATSSDTDIVGIITFGPVSGGPPSASPFLCCASNFEAHPVTSGNTLGPLPIFTLTVPLGAPLGTVYMGSINFGYTHGHEGDPVLNTSANYSVTVGTPVFEPGTLLLLSSGLAGAGMLTRLRPRRNGSRASN